MFNFGMGTLMRQHEVILYGEQRGPGLPRAPGALPGAQEGRGKSVTYWRAASTSSSSVISLCPQESSSSLPAQLPARSSPRMLQRELGWAGSSRTPRFCREQGLWQAGMGMQQGRVTADPFHPSVPSISSTCFALLLVHRAIMQLLSPTAQHRRQQITAREEHFSIKKIV